MDPNFSSKILKNGNKLKKYFKSKSRKNSKSTQRIENVESRNRTKGKKYRFLFKFILSIIFSIIQQHVMVFATLV